MLTALVEEMNPVTASSLSLPWSFHEQCRSSFADTMLQQVFRTAVAAAGTQQAPTAESIGAQQFVKQGWIPGMRVRMQQVHLTSDSWAITSGTPVNCAEATTLMTHILTWDLNRSTGFALSASSFGVGRTASAATNPPAATQLSHAWLELALSPALLQWALAALRSTGQAGIANAAGAALQPGGQATARRRGGPARLGSILRARHYGSAPSRLSDNPAHRPRLSCLGLREVCIA